MDRQKLMEHTKKVINSVASDSVAGGYATACQFLRTYAGPKNSFLETLLRYDPRSANSREVKAASLETLQAFHEYVEAGLHDEVSPERQAQLDVVSDFLEQAQRLLEARQVHPAAAAVLVGATLEEFLRTWVESEGLSLGNRKPGLEAYAQMLREANLISKQDIKDITSWAGIRNHAAHGEWQEVSDKQRVVLMLEGANLFMRKYGLAYHPPPAGPP